jgi:hypothetical protein
VPVDGAWQELVVERRVAGLERSLARDERQPPSANA